MNRPIISYHVLNTDDTYTKQNSVYAGTYTGDNTLSVNLRIWNNFCGTEDVEDLQNFNLVLRFLTKEDNALLNYIEIIADNEILGSIIENDALVGTFASPRILSGEANTGSDEYISNYINVTISFHADTGVYLKDHDLKSLVLDIVEI